MEFEDKARDNKMPSFFEMKTTIVAKLPTRQRKAGAGINPLLPVCAQFKVALEAINLTQKAFAKLAGLQPSNVCSAYHLNLKVSPKMIGKMQKTFKKLGYKCDVASWFAKREVVGDYRTSTYACRGAKYVTHPTRQHLTISAKKPMCPAWLSPSGN